MNKGDITKQRIIATAAAVINIKGIAGTSVDDVVKSAKIARGCLYGHFENKEALALASVGHLLKVANDHRDFVMSSRKSSFLKILSFLKMNEDPLSPLGTGGCPVVNLGTEADDTNPAIKEMIKKDIADSLEIFTKILGEGIINGEFSDKLIPERFALKMLCALKGAIVFSKVNDSLFSIKTVVRELRGELEGYLLKPKSF